MVRDSGSAKAVEQSPNHPKVWGSLPATAAATGRQNGQKLEIGQVIKLIRFKTD